MVYWQDITTKFKMNRIKEVLEARELSQIWLAKELGKSYNMVNSYAQNRRQPSIEVLYRIADILEVEAKDLLKEKRLIKK
jgi:transcriptional regulator with XRE-family HTH domain